MFSSRFANIINRQPARAQELALVADYLDAAAAQDRLHRLRLDPQHIQQISKLQSSADLAVLISILLSEHILNRVIVVQSPEGGGVAEFSSVDEVPEIVHDHLRDTHMKITSGNLRTIYTVSTLDDA